VSPGAGDPSTEEPDDMLIDCDQCAMQATAACGDCVVTHLFRLEEGPVRIDDTEVAALEALADHGLVPILRLVPRAVNE